MDQSRRGDDEQSSADRAADGDPGEVWDVGAEAEVGVNAGAGVGVHDHDRPLLVATVPFQRLEAGALDAGSPERLTGGDGRGGRAGAALGGQGEGIEVELGDPLVGNAGQVLLDVLAAGDTDEERLVALATDAELRARGRAASRSRR